MTASTAAPAAMREWLDAATQRAEMRHEAIGVDECEGWERRDGRVVHRSGAFFSVCAVEVCSSGGAANGESPVMIDQPEVGRLGFAVAPGPDGGWRWLAQAKSEPGTASGAQIAPTVQATRSNYRRVHGGRPTEYLGLFESSGLAVADTAQSEQGGRFLWKFNRNTTILVDPAVEPVDDRFRWLGQAELRVALGRSSMVNTDARSVIATTPWHHLGSGGPLFTSLALQRSYAAGPDRSERLDRVWRRHRRHDRLRWSFGNIERHDRWRVDGRGVEAAGSGSGVAFFRVGALDREVESWCQPLLTSAEPQEAVLLLRERNGVLSAYVRVQRELGFGDRNELSPTAGPDGPSLSGLVGVPIRELVAIEQDDEGGRFMRSTCRYRVCLATGEIDEGAIEADGEWLTLATLEALVNEPGATTNELRTLVSLLLSSACDEALAGIGL